MNIESQGGPVVIKALLKKSFRATLGAAVAAFAVALANSIVGPTIAPASSQGSGSQESFVVETSVTPTPGDPN